MPAPMPPQAAPEQGAPKEQGQASQIVAQIGDLMSQLLDLMHGKLPDADVQQFAGIQQAYQAFVDKVLGGGADDQGAPPQGPAPGAVPEQAGANPNAKPV